jgi:cyanophycinase
MLFASRLGELAMPRRSTRSLLIPMGAGYKDTMQGFLQAVLPKHTPGRKVRVLLLAMTYSTDAATILPEERAQNLHDAHQRKLKLEQNCRELAPQVTFDFIVSPVFTRADALDADAVKPLTKDLAAIFFLGGDQNVAMEVLADTPLEAALAAAYARGVPICGTSAGSSMLSVVMMAGYHDDYTRGNALSADAVEVWSAPKRGLNFGLPHAILDQHFFQRGRVARLLNAIRQAPHVGLGIDAYTGAYIRGGAVLENVFGLYTVAVLDGATYRAHETAHYVGKGQVLSMRDVLVHLLAPGDSHYDFVRRQHSLAKPPHRRKRVFDLRLPQGAGPLLLGGNLLLHRTPTQMRRSAVLRRFVQLTGKRTHAKILVVVTGYPDGDSTRAATDRYVDALKGHDLTVRAFGDETQLPDGAFDGLLFIGGDQSLIDVARVHEVREHWLRGVPVLADGGAAAACGVAFSAHGPTPMQEHDAELAAQASFKRGGTSFAAGLALLPALFEPQVMVNNRWGRLFSLAYQHPEHPAFGLTDDSALEVTHSGARVVGENAVFALDMRHSTRAYGSNDALVFANGLLDVFAPDDTLT